MVRKLVHAVPCLVWLACAAPRPAYQSTQSTPPVYWTPPEPRGNGLADEVFEDALVQPGNTAPLNDAADPYAKYLGAFHRQLHVQFADRYLASLRWEEMPWADPTLVTTVEIVVAPDGSLPRLAVIRSSGVAEYDRGAVDAVAAGAPYPPTPAAIRSPDGNTYLHWRLHRDENQCATWNSQPYILRSIPTSSVPKAAPDASTPVTPAGAPG